MLFNFHHHKKNREAEKTDLRKIQLCLAHGIQQFCQVSILHTSQNKLVFVQLAIIIDIKLLENMSGPLLSNLLETWSIKPTTNMHSGLKGV